MLTHALLALVLQAPSSAASDGGPGCPGGGALTAAVQLTMDAQKGGDTKSAKAQVDPLVASCDAASQTGWAARALRAELAAGEKDWAGVRRALEGVSLDRPTPLSARLGYLRLEAHKSLGDAAAFTRDRDALLAANAAGLARRGRLVETFTAGPYKVTAFEAVFDQGALRRLIEFVGAPNDPGAYPVTVTITDDLNVTRMAAQMAAKEGKPPSRVFFTDLYYCSGHATLAPPPPGPDGGPPSYAQAKPLAVAAFENMGRNPAGSSISLPGPGCPAAQWITPGVGLPPPPPRPPG